MISATIDDDEFMSLVNEIWSKIDEDYKEDIDKEKNIRLKKYTHDIPDFVIPIKSINELYTHQARIGKGVSGSVFLSQSKQSYKQYALKQMLREDKLNHYSFVHEINILKQLNHPNIIHLNDAYIANKCYYITTQYCSGGTLLQRLNTIRRGRFSERNAAHLMKQILEAIDYIHSKNIVHRDLKLSNIVFENGAKYSTLKLIDFGQSEIITNMEETTRNIVGSLHFIAPETVQSRKKRDLFATDIWAVGVIAYILVQGVFPFHANNIVSMTQRIKSPLKWLYDVAISDCCRHFIQSLLHTDCRKRYTVKEALKHPWIVNADVHVGNKCKQTAMTAAKTKKEPAVAMKLVAQNTQLDIEKILAEIDADMTDNRSQ